MCKHSSAWKGLVLYESTCVGREEDTSSLLDSPILLNIKFPILLNIPLVIFNMNITQYYQYYSILLFQYYSIFLTLKLCFFIYNMCQYSSILQATSNIHQYSSILPEQLGNVADDVQGPPAGLVTVAEPGTGRMTILGPGPAGPPAAWRRPGASLQARALPAMSSAALADPDRRLHTVTVSQWPLPSPPRPGPG